MRTESRRHLRRLSACVAMSCLVLAGCRREAPPDAAPSAAPGTAPEASQSTQDKFAYAEADIATLQARMRRGEFDSRALTRAYLDRIAAIDDAGPRLRAVIELNPDALREAEAPTPNARRASRAARCTASPFC